MIMIVILLRITLIAIWLILTSLVVPDLILGGRILILFEAVVIGFLSYMIRILTIRWGNSRWRSLISASSLFIGLAIVKLTFPGIRLSVVGIFVAYTGLILMELIIPDNDHQSTVRT